MRSKLKLEEISVESFATGAVPPRAGTVRAHDSDEQPGGGEEPGGGGTIERVTCDWTVCYDSCYSCPTGLGPLCCV